MEQRPNSAYPALIYYYCACGMVGSNPEYHQCMKKGEPLKGKVLENFQKGGLSLND